MKKIYTIALGLITSLALTSNISAQTAVKLKLNHKAGSNTFAKNTTVANNLGDDYQVSRLEYYISEIIVIHDGGKKDTIKDKYILAQPNGASETYDLGSVNNLTTVEAIQFSIGVDKGSNHLNPADYLPTHPLAPKSPSMHWGWSAGYRFIAIEGKSGTSLNRSFELHGLGDGNYFGVRIPTTATDDNGAKVIELNADYGQILKDIVLKNGVIAHGVDDQDKKALENMRDHVFTSTSGQGNTLSVVRARPLAAVTVYPNPGNTSEGVRFSVKGKDNLSYTIIDMCGKTVKKVKGSPQMRVQLNQRGIYQVLAIDPKGVQVASGKLIIQ